MFFGRKTSQRIANGGRASSGFTLCLFSAGLLAGCGEATPLSLQPAQPALQQVSNDQPQLAAMMPALDFLPAGDFDRPLEPAPEDTQNQFWSFPRGAAENTLDPPALIRLPAVDEVPESYEISPPEPTLELTDDQPIAQLLPPLPIVVEQAEMPEPLVAFPATDTFPPADSFPTTGFAEIEIETAAPGGQSPLPVLAELTAQEQSLAALLQDSSSAATGVLTDTRVNELAKTKIQQAYAMASRGALYVAQQELVEVLRMISQAKDAQQGTPERTVALSAGLRALREAEDFAPRGTQLEAELEIAVLCASHRTPIAQQPESAKLLPRLMMDRYLRYAQLQLALSVAGEPAGSMALHALGKLNSQLGSVEPDQHRLADRRAIAYQQAALLAHNQNYLAAHELGVLLAASGHLAEAQQLLLQVAAREPNAVVYRNLARVQEKLGQAQQSLTNRDYARQLSQQGATGTNNIQWVSPNQFTQASPQTPRYATAQRPTAEQVVVPGSRSVAPTVVRR